MKVAILTLPLHVNYGGILQAYALAKTLQNLGCEVSIINYRKQYPTVKNKIWVIAKNIIKRYIFRRDTKELIPFFSSKRNMDVITQNIKTFVEKYLDQSEEIFNEGQLKKYCLDRFDLCVVGSDQVWRPCFAPLIHNHFLGFLADQSEITKISYAASFGVDQWEYSAEETSICKELIHKFDAVSVREDSAVGLCKDKFDINAEHALDPTLLLTAKAYIDLLDGGRKSAGNLFAYILDENPEKSILIKRIEKKYKLKSFNVKGKILNGMARKNMNEFVAPPVEDWIMAFRDAEFVVTDSFHGCVFAIIFNKPFFAIGNKERGITRFKSLLSIFELKNRLIDGSNDLTDEKIIEIIDWNRVNIILEEQRDKSLNFLRSNILVSIL